MRARRRGLDTATRALAAANLAHAAESLELFKHARHLAGYIAVEGELDPALVLQRAHAAGKQVYLPVVPAEPQAPLGFALWMPDAPLTPNRFGIPEPAAPHRLLPPPRLDLVLAPLVAFDDRGHRLGMGGGYYDRSFAFLKAHPAKPVLLGVAYEFQRLPALPHEHWDVPLAGVITEARCHFFGPPGHGIP